MSFVKKMFISLFVVLFMFAAFVTSKLFLELKVYNFMVSNFSATKTGSDDIVLIVLDDRTIGRYRLPWKRDLNCKIFKYFNDYTDAKLIIHDAIIVTPDKDNPESDRNYYSFISSVEKFMAGFAFASNPAQGNERYEKEFKTKFSGMITDNRKLKTADKYSSIVRFPKDYFNALKMAGSVCSPVNLDGYLRSMPHVIPYKGVLYPSLALRAYSYLNGNENYKVSDTHLTGNKSGLKLRRDTIKNMIAVQIRYYKLLNNSPYSHKAYSAVDIMDSYDALRNGKTPMVSPVEFKDKVVFVGANVNAVAAGMSDLLPTPMKSRHAGVDIQATALDNLMHNDTLAPAPAWLNLFIAFVFIFTVFLMIRYNGILQAVSYSALLFITYMVICAYLYKFGISIDVATPVCMGIIAMIFSYSYKFILENINKEKVKNAMGKYISQDVMRSVVKNIDNLALGGKKAVVTVLFADIRGFTSISEKLSAEEVSLILNEYFTEIEPIISKYNGVINKFIGDAVLAIFGEPIIDENHAENAVKCANEMLNTVKKLRHKWLNEGKPKIEIGIGINTGEVFLGNIGSEKRMEYTVIGDTVNLASRIESYNKVYKTDFLISSSTYQYVSNLADVIKISEVSIRGKSQKTTIYEVLRLIG